MIRRTTILALELAAGLLVGFAILIGIVAWRLSAGPITLSFLNPYIMEALSPDAGGFRVEVEGTVLTWVGWDRTFDIRALGVRAIGEGEIELARVPEIALRLNIGALTRGLVAPTQLEVMGARLRVVRDADGGIEFGVGEGGRSFQSILLEIRARLAAGPDGDSALSYLKTVRIVDGELTIDDRKTGMLWRATLARMALERDARGVRGDADLDLVVGDQAPRFRLDGLYDVREGTIEVGAGFDQVKPAAFARVMPELERLGIADLPFGGQFRIRMDGNGRMLAGGFNLSSGAGTVELPGLYPKGLPVTMVQASGRVFDGLGRITIENLLVDLGGPTLVATAELEPAGAESRLQIDVAVHAMPIEDLGRYWPQGVTANAIAWIEKNLSVGTVEEASASIVGVLGSGGKFDIASIDGTLVYKALSVGYIDGMPPVRGVDGTARFDAERFDLFLESGDLEGIALHEGTIEMTGLNTGFEIADMAFKLDGSVPDFLRVIDREPFHYTSKLGVSPDDLDGAAIVDMTVNLPLIATLPLVDIEIGVTAALDGLEWRQVAMGLDGKGGDLRLALDTAAMSVEGRISLGTIPLDLVWNESFSDDAPVATRIDLTGILDDEDRALLGLDARPAVTGPTSTRIQYASANGTAATVVAELDLTDAHLSLADFLWEKESGIQASARAELHLVDEHLSEIVAFSVVGGGLSAEGAARFGPGGGLTAATVTHVAFNGNDLRGAVTPREGGGYDVEIEGAHLNAEPFLVGDDEEPEAGPLMPLRVTLDLARVTLGPGREVGAVTGELVRDDRFWRKVFLDATLREEGLAGDQRLSVRYGPNPDGQELTITADDAGAALRTFDVVDTVVGGTLAITGQAADSAPDSPMTGKALIENYYVVDAPVLARLLTFVSLTGIVDLLNDEGIQFEHLEVPFVRIEGEIEFADAHARGSELCLTASGKVETQADSIDLEGLIVPACTINSFWEDIPLLGDILVPEKGGGVFAATYSVKGPMAEPTVRVNPLSVLTPGFLRGVFDIFSGTDEPARGDLESDPNSPGSQR